MYVNVLISHCLRSDSTEMLLHHLDTLGLRVNVQKSVFIPSQTITGHVFRLVAMRSHFSQDRRETILSTLRHFRLGRSDSLREFQRLLRLMAAASSVCHLGLLHMRPLQFWLKTRVPLRTWSSGHTRIPVTNSCISALRPWRNPDMFSLGVHLGLVTQRTVVSTDASTSGWGAVCLGVPVSGLWSESQRE